MDLRLQTNGQQAKLGPWICFTWLVQCWPPECLRQRETKRERMKKVAKHIKLRFFCIKVQISSCFWKIRRSANPGFLFPHSPMVMVSWGEIAAAPFEQSRQSLAGFPLPQRPLSTSEMTALNVGTFPIDYISSPLKPTTEAWSKTAASHLFQVRWPWGRPQWWPKRPQEMVRFGIYLEGSINKILRRFGLGNEREDLKMTPILILT